MSHGSQLLCSDVWVQLQCMLKSFVGTLGITLFLEGKTKIVVGPRVVRFSIDRCPELSDRVLSLASTEQDSPKICVCFSKVRFNREGSLECILGRCEIAPRQ